MSKDEIKNSVRAYIGAQFLPDEDPANIGNETELISSGVLDSLASLNLVSWLEEHFGVSIAAHEVDVDHLNTIDLIADLVASKKAP